MASRTTESAKAALAIVIKRDMPLRDNELNLEPPAKMA